MKFLSLVTSFTHFKMRGVTEIVQNRYPLWCELCKVLTGLCNAW